MVTKKEEFKYAVKEQYSEILIIRIANNNLFSSLNDNLDKNYTLGMDNYPKTRDDD